MVVKAQTIKTGSARPGGVLPPAGGRTTPEAVALAAETLPAQAAPAAPPQETSTVPSLPDASAPPAEIEKAADAIIAEANLQLQAAETRAAVAWVGSVAPALRLVWETDAHKQAIDPSTGKPYRGVRKWAADRRISKSQFYRLINEVPVREALADAYSGQMGSREAEFGARLLRANDAEAVRRVWLRAVELGGAKLKNLETAAKALGLQLSNVKDSDEEEPEISGRAKAILSLALPARRGWDADEVRTLAASDLKGTRESIAELDRFRAVLVSALPDGE